MDEDNQQPETEEKPKKTLTPKQRLWLQHYIETGNKTEAALFAYYPEIDLKKSLSDYSEEERKQYDSARVIGWENLTKLNIPIDELMDEAGLSDTRIIQVLNENLSATKLYGKSAIEHMDANARNKAAEIALRVKGKLVGRIDLTSKGKSIVPTAKVAKALQAILEEDDEQQFTNENNTQPEEDQSNTDSNS